ncbi:hypothetical protein [Castellaniella sp.]|nr:hypothetical protein [Castellaniella sp.]
MVHSCAAVAGPASVQQAFPSEVLAWKAGTIIANETDEASGFSL